MTGQQVNEPTDGFMSQMVSLDFIARTYVDAVGQERSLELAGEELRTGLVTYEHLGAFLVAQRIASLALPTEVLQPLRRLLEELADPSSRAVTALFSPHPAYEILERGRVQRRYEAFRLGLDRAPIQDQG